MLNSSILIVLLCVICTIITRTVGQNLGRRSDNEKVRLFHYPNPRNVTERYDVAQSIENAKLARNKRLKIVVHGAGSHCLKDDVPFRIIAAYLRAKVSGREDYNILCLEYAPLEQGPIPGEHAPTLRKVYEYVCDTASQKAVSLILELKANGYITSFDQIHVVGHSLGGQVSGYIGRKIREQTNSSIGRISGLDIANIFLVYNNEVNLLNQLDLSDAKFVDIIHTSPIGLKGDYGHVDFYPDGGLHQRSCLTKGPVSNVTELIIGSCSHLIVGKYWENSIDSANVTACKDESWESFQAKKVDNCKPQDRIILGEYVPTSARGKYFLHYPLLKI